MYRKLEVDSICMYKYLKCIKTTQLLFITILSRATQTQKVIKFATYLVVKLLLSNARCHRGSRFSQSWI